ncbi:meiotic recombination protein REC8 homolog [Boleophthalmus pectinirostris]|uniref:meiotic recombination protein REC8 homolog n=1 Tax=Boleophthalmus pectinirostris TaxID=150288 RepID=UPI002431C7B5|nr:meiotic recombination protein REC8 homolog [Boleophthalmus pectinirostris]
MFYYPAVLRRHTGCFSTVWLVATKGIRVTRRDFLKVNVTKTCDDIMDYLLERVEPPRADLPRPRFSLYLSSQLQYGVILVYHRQCAILLEETQYAVDWLLKQKTAQRNDMDDHSRPAPLLKDVLSLMEETEGAPDPLFGQMYMQEELPSPTALLWVLILSILAHSISRQHHPAGARALSMPFTEFEGMELAELPSTVDVLLAETDQFPEGELLRAEPGAELEREQERGAVEQDGTKELTDSTAELLPTATTLLSEDQALLPQDKPHLPPQPPAPPVDQLTPVSAPVMPSPPSAADRRDRRERQRAEMERVSSPEEVLRRRRRRRQLIFMDVDTQLSQEEQQQQISDPHAQTAPASLLTRPSLFKSFALDLLNAASTSLVSEELQLLWRRAAVITPVPGSDLQTGERGTESTDSEKDREGAEREGEGGEMMEAERQEESSKEIPRDEAEAEQLDVSAVISLHLEGSDHMEGSREISPMFTPDKEGSAVSRSVSVLQDIPEEAAEAVGGPLQPSPSQLEVTPQPCIKPQRCPKPVCTAQERLCDFLCRLLQELLEREEGPTSFQSLLPLGADRRTVSHFFAKLLEDLSFGKLQAEQTAPYGDILLSACSGSL